MVGRALLAIALAAATSAADPGSLVVTTSMLDAAVREVLPADAGIELVLLAPPGACPGHFDLSPRAVPALRRAQVLVRHGFQSGLDERLAGLGLEGLRVVEVASEGSLLEPAVYLRVVDEVAEVVGEVLPGRRDEIARARTTAALRIAALEEEVRESAAAWRGRPVIAGAQQRAFCDWLGLEVAGVLERPEDLTPRDLARLLELSPEAVVGNLQSDGEAAKSLAGRLGVPAAVLSNFPGAEGYGSGYDELLRANLDRLRAALAAR